MDYTNYTYESTYSNADSGLLASMGIGVMLIMLLIAIATIVGIWKVYQKAGKPGWGSIIPFYNTYLLFEIGGYNGWLFLLGLIPIVGWIIIFIFNILIAVNISKSFGKSGAFAVGLIFLPTVFYIILGFSNAKYTPLNETQTAGVTNPTPMKNTAPQPMPNNNSNVAPTTMPANGTNPNPSQLNNNQTNNQNNN